MGVGWLLSCLALPLSIPLIECEKTAHLRFALYKEKKFFLHVHLILLCLVYFLALSLHVALRHVGSLRST